MWRTPGPDQVKKYICRSSTMVWLEPGGTDRVGLVCDYNLNVRLFYFLNNIPWFVPLSPSTTNSGFEGLPDFRSQSFRLSVFKVRFRTYVS